MGNNPVDRKELILDTALKLFTKNGFFNTSVHDIQKDAMVSIGSIYHHFGNKEAIAKSLFHHIESDITGIIESIMVNHETAHDRCRAVIAKFFEITEHNPDQMNFLLYAKHREFMPDQQPLCSSRPFSLMSQIVDEGMERGEIRRMDPLVAAVAVFGGAIRLIFLELDGVLENPLRSYLHECWQCAWRSVTG
ncbi:TetR/AcrR family transcriptional regulator [Desulforhopalus singaporensis]|uniref:Transcriptional regulator, TetR family n=1 Tax=Desulforhopalus singaporensis TaxID=91360 RepID=A0A1H0LE10_9BACT|nr:TetR/AcrR family transcriptional regulator [Desulforhopalus singaporensis]SDO66365.1 transcriptional regulator, TetR family [Desulforhopalus singaporensis]